MTGRLMSVAIAAPVSSGQSGQCHHASPTSSDVALLCASGTGLRSVQVGADRITVGNEGNPANARRVT